MTLARLTRRSALTALMAAGLAPSLAAARSEDWKALAADVRSEFQWAWQGYVAKAWGKDEINPVSGTSRSFFIEGHDLGLSLVEALDTKYPDRPSLQYLPHALRILDSVLQGYLDMGEGF